MMKITTVIAAALLTAACASGVTTQTGPTGISMDTYRDYENDGSISIGQVFRRGKHVIATHGQSHPSPVWGVLGAGITGAAIVYGAGRIDTSTNVKVPPVTVTPIPAPF